MNINEAAKNWTQLGKEDPMWAILSGKEKRGNKWAQDEFFATGREQIANVLRVTQEAGLTVRFGRALDFGCGLGRLSQALAERFTEVHGVDVSESMVEQARQFNKFGGKVTYHLNVKTNLSVLPKNHFDFICSLIVLQHIPTQHQLLYIADFMDLLAPGGVAFFQTIHAKSLRALAPQWLVEKYRKFKHGDRSYMPMNGVSPYAIRTITEGHGAFVQKHMISACDEETRRFVTDIFIVSKKAKA